MRALRVTQWECGFGVACAGIGLALIVTRASLTAAVVTLLLFCQASFYLAAPAYSLMSVRGEVQPVRLTSRGDIHGRIITESRASRWAFALIVLLLIGYGLLRLLPEPTATPKYAQFQPVEIQPQELIGLPPLPTATRIPRTSPTAVPASATPTQQVPTPTLPFISPPTETPLPAQPSAETQSPPTDTPSSPTQTPTQPSATPPTPTSTQRPLPTQAPTQRPLPTQVPTQPPLPTQASTQPSQPTQPSPPTRAPTQPPQPTQPPPPTQVPTLPPIPTQPPQPV